MNADMYNTIKGELEASVIPTGRKIVGLSASSIKNYIAKVKMLKIENPKDTLETITKAYPNLNSRLAYQTAVLGMYKHSKTFADFITKPVQESILKANDTDNEIVKNAPTQIKSDRELENWVDLKEIKKMVVEKAMDYPLQERLLIAIYTEMPPARLDYNKVHIIRTSFINETTGLPEGITAKDNYIQVFKQKTKIVAKIVIQEHKTDYDGDLENKIPKKVLDLITQLPMTQNFLFETKGGKPFASAETFGAYLRTIFLKLTGKTLSVDILRHIYITHFRKGEKSTKNKKELADAMGHSINLQEEYRRVD